MRNYNVHITPSKPKGYLLAPPSKSISHRLLIASALATGVSNISNVALSEDIVATIGALRAIGAKVEASETEGTLRVTGIGGTPTTSDVINCSESGSTLRFMIPICLLSDGRLTLTGSPRLLSRPLGAYTTLFKERLCLHAADRLEIKEGKAISGGEYTLRGNETSQYITGLLFALPLCKADSRIVVTEPFESASYVALTLETLAKFGVIVTTKKEDGATVFEIRGGQKYTPTDGAVEGDASNAAFFASLNLLGGEVLVGGLNPNSLQGDSVFNKHFENLRCGGKAPIDLSDCPDLAPILFALAAHFGYGEFTHTQRLRLKESDRVAASEEELSKFGASFEEYEDTGGRLIVRGGNLTSPSSTLSSHNDHRIAMSLSVLCTRYGGTVEDAGAVAKSMPDFFGKLTELGVSIRITERQ